MPWPMCRTIWAFFDKERDLLVEWEEETRRVDFKFHGPTCIMDRELDEYISFLKGISKFIKEKSHGDKKKK